MLSFDYLKGVYIIIFHSAAAIYTLLAEIKVTQVERHANQFEQKLKRFKYEEKVNYLHDFCSRPLS